MSDVAQLRELSIRRRIRIPMRDGLCLNAHLCEPAQYTDSTACVVSLTPYGADHLHDRGAIFVHHGLRFLVVDVCGRADSEGIFVPHARDAHDGYDVVEWVARQPFCNGRVGMYGGSYLGSAQWAAASLHPPHLKSIAPTAAPYLGVDTPMRGNIFSSYEVRWLTLVSGRTTQSKRFADEALWSQVFRVWFESGRSFRELDRIVGEPSGTFQNYLDHPEQGAYWDALNPSAEAYERIDMPILTLTGIYDGDQLGALEHYRQHMRHASAAARAKHYLVIGPWNHAGCTLPKADFDGIRIAPAGVLDLYQFHAQWCAWTLAEGTKPEFLKDAVAYYCMGADMWRYAPSLDAVTARVEPLYLHSTENPTDVFHSGELRREPPQESSSDCYFYDPRDTRTAELESTLDHALLTEQRRVNLSAGRHLVYHSAPFESDTEISGFFRLTAHLSIDRSDTDFRVSVYEIDTQGNSILLTMDQMRARYRKSLRHAELIDTQDPLCYEFNRFTFVSRFIRRSHRLRLVIGPINSIHEQRNFNGGGDVADECMSEAKAVTVELFHDTDYASVLFVPIGQGSQSCAQEVQA